MIIKNGYVRDVDGQWYNLNSFHRLEVRMFKKDRFVIVGDPIHVEYTEAEDHLIELEVFGNDEDAINALDEAFGYAPGYGRC